MTEHLSSGGGITLSLALLPKVLYVKL